MDFLLGCNYWDSASGTDMWKNWNEGVVRSDLEALSKIGVKHLRVFPNWRDFQPIEKYIHYAGAQYDYFTPDGTECEAPDYVDMRMIRRFKKFAEIAEDNGMTLTVSLLTGWMSGRIFSPPALTNKNLLTDKEALVLTNKYITKLVKEFKEINNIVMWDLGNECNSMGQVSDNLSAYIWTMTVRNAIRAVDSTRPISSGMHSLQEDGGSVWSLKDQGELCDMMTTHPYPSPTIKNDIDPMNKMRSTIFPTAQSEFYSGISGKPCMIQEQGSFSDLAGTPEMSADFARVNIFSAWANGLKGYLWWCGMEHTLLEQPPYNWSMIERSLGMVYLDRTPKPIGIAFKKASEVIEKLPETRNKKVDAVCYLTDFSRQDKAMVSYVLAKQAGINLEFRVFGDKIPETDLLFVPSCHGSDFFNKQICDDIFDRVKNGMTLFMSASAIHMCFLKENFGFISKGMVRSGKRHTAHFPFGNIDYTCGKEILIESAGAQVLAVNEENNPVMTKFKLGKGYVYFLNFDMEISLATGFDVFNKKPLYSDIYRMIDKVKEKADEYLISTDDSRIGITQSECDGGFIVTAVNYSDEDIEFKCKIKDGFDISVLYGSLDKIPHCDAVIVKFIKK